MNRKRRRRRARMRRILVVGPVLAAAALFAVGSFLPGQCRTETRVRLVGSPETVWAVLTDLDGMTAWRGDLRSLERLPGVDGMVRWVEHGRRGRLAFEQAAADPPRRLVVRSVGAGVPLVRRTYEIRRTPGGTDLRVVEVRQLRGALARLAAWTFGPDRSPVDRLLADLAARLTGRRRQVTAGPAVQAARR